MDPSHSTDNSNLADLITDSTFAQRERHVLDVTNQLRSFAAHEEVDLPCIAVTGSQSVGKSSVIEAISGVEVPRATGTCTRCPMEIRLVRSKRGDYKEESNVNIQDENKAKSSPNGEIQHDEYPEWTCRIALRFEKDKNKKSRKGVVEIPFGDLITDRGHVEERLRRAQSAILNPTTSLRDLTGFLSADLESPLLNEKEVTFSENVICVTISGPECVDLTFVDLPGLISATKNVEDEKDIELIEALVTEYISKSNCVILLTLAMSADIETQKAFSLARRLDGDGRRTIYVLTKPDQVSGGDDRPWVSLLTESVWNESSPYYVTKQRNTRNLEQRTSLDEAKRDEAHFFETVPPWSEWPASSDLGKRLGTPNLVAKLSEILLDITEERLPKLKAEVDTSLTKILDKLQKLPPPPSKDPARELMQLCASFGTEVNHFIRGARPTTMSLVHEEKKVVTELKQRILRTRPRFHPCTRKERNITSLVEPQNILDDLEELSTIKSEEVKLGKKSKAEMFPSDATVKFGAEHWMGNGIVDMDLDDVRSHIENNRGWGLLFDLPPEIKKDLMSRPVGLWFRIGAESLNQLRPHLEDLMFGLVEQRFGRFCGGLLAEDVMEVIKPLVDQHANATLQQIERFIQLEADPWTTNDHYLSANRHLNLEHFKKCRSPAAHHVQSPKAVDDPDTLFTPNGSPSPAPTVLFASRLNPNSSKFIPGGAVKASSSSQTAAGDDSYEPELILMAEVLAYFKVAQKRIIDNICMAIHKWFILPFEDTLQEALVSGLGISSPNSKETCARYLQENRKTRMDREDLMNSKEKLENAKRTLRRL